MSHPLRTGVLVLATALLAGCGSGGSIEKTPRLDPAVAAFVQDIRVVEANDHVFVLNTEKGMIAIELRNTKAPLSTQAIEVLAKKRFYEGLTFHFVDENFAIQTGDPSNGGGSTSASTIPLEVNADLTNSLRGAVGMAHPEDQRNAATTEFYILLAPKPHLDGSYAVFGQVVKGMEVADTIEQGDKILSTALVQGLAVEELPKQ